MIDIIYMASNAASSTVATSSKLASSLHILSSLTLGGVSSYMTTAQAKLSILKSNIATLPDLVVMSLAITDAHDASIRAAEHSTS